VSAVRRVAVAQRLAADGRRQDADGQPRVRGHRSGRAALGRRRLRAAAQVRAVQHRRGGAQGAPVAGVGLPRRVEEIQVGRHRVDGHVRHRPRVGHRHRAADRRGRVAAVRVRQGRAERSARARPDTGHRPVRAARPVRRRRGSATRQDRPVHR